MSLRPGSRTWRGFASPMTLVLSVLVLSIVAPLAVADVPHVPICAQNAISTFMVQNHCESDYKCLCSPGLRPGLDANIGQTCPSVDHRVALQGIEMDCSSWLASTTTSSKTSAPTANPTTLVRITAAAATDADASKTKSAQGAQATNTDPMDGLHDGIPDTVKIGIGVGLGMSLPLLAVIAYLVYRMREQRMAHAIELAKLKGWEPGVAMS